MTPFIFDPEHPDLLADKWAAEVGVLHPDARINGWAFFRGNGEFIDWWVPDVNGEWVDVANPAGFSDAWAALADRASQLGATDTIMIHTHPASQHMTAPCQESMDILTSAVIEMSLHKGPMVRACLILRGTTIEGAVWTNEAPDELRQFDTVEEMEAYAASKADPNLDALRDSVLADGDRLIAEMEVAAARGDEFAREILPVMKSIQEALRNGSVDGSLIEQGMNIAGRAAQGMKSRPNPFDLPPLQVPKIRFTN